MAVDVRDFTPEAEQEIAKYVVKEFDKIIKNEIEMMSVTECIENWSKLDESIRNVDLEKEGLNLNYSVLQSLITECFMNAREIDDNYNLIIADDLEEGLSAYNESMNKLIQCINTASLGSSVESIRISIVEQESIFGDEISFQKQVDDAGWGIVQQIYEKLKDDVDIDGALYEALQMSMEDTDFWHLQAMAMILNSYIIEESNGKYNIDFEKLQKFINAGFKQDTSNTKDISSGFEIYPTITYIPTGAFQALAEYMDALTQGQLLQYDGAVSDYANAVETYIESITYMNAILNSVSACYSEVKLHYDKAGRYNFKITIDGSEAYYTKGSENVTIKLNNTDKNIVIYRYYDRTQAANESIHSLSLEELKDTDYAYLKVLSTGFEEMFLSKSKKSTESFILMVTDTSMPSSIKLARNIISVLRKGDKAQEEAERYNQGIYKKVIAGNLRKNAYATYCGGTVVSCGDEYYLFNRHVDQKSLAIDVAYYNAYNPEGKTITVENLVQEMLTYCGDDIISGTSSKLQDFSDFNQGEDLSKDIKYTYNYFYDEVILELGKPKPSASIEELQEACKNVLGD